MLTVIWWNVMAAIWWYRDRHALRMSEDWLRQSRYDKGGWPW